MVTQALIKVQDAPLAEFAPSRTPAERAAMLEQVIIQGNLKSLDPKARVDYYHAVCRASGVPVEIRPFEYIEMQGKLVLYALRSCTEFLRKRDGVSVVQLVKRVHENGMLEIEAHLVNRWGKQDIATGCLAYSGLKGDAASIAMMKCETKAKRRGTLSICGLGMLDETEVEGLEVQPPTFASAAPAAIAPADAPPSEPVAIAWADFGDTTDSMRIFGTVTLVDRKRDGKSEYLLLTIVREDADSAQYVTRRMDLEPIAAAACTGKVMIEARFVAAGDKRRIVSLRDPQAGGTDAA